LGEPAHRGSDFNLGCEEKREVSPFLMLTGFYLGRRICTMGKKSSLMADGAGDRVSGAVPFS
jgi:hypothetical protein